MIPTRSSSYRGFGKRQYAINQKSWLRRRHSHRRVTSGDGRRERDGSRAPTPGATLRFHLERRSAEARGSRARRRSRKVRCASAPRDLLLHSGQNRGLLSEPPLCGPSLWWPQKTSPACDHLPCAGGGGSRVPVVCVENNAVIHKRQEEDKRCVSRSHNRKPLPAPRRGPQSACGFTAWPDHRLCLFRTAQRLYIGVEFCTRPAVLHSRGMQI